MSTAITCPSCKRVLNLPAEALNRVVQCPACKHQFHPAEATPAEHVRAALPRLAGHYVYGDFGSGHIWAVPAAGPYTPVQIAQGNAISSFGEDAAGELYVADLATGQISKLVAAP